MLTACAPTNAQLPDGVQISVFQNRSDYASRTLVIGVVNTTDAPLHLDRAEFSSPRFSDASVWERGTTLRPGAQVDLRVPLAETVCGVESAPTVTLGFTIDGVAGSATVVPVDDRGRLDEINREECLDDAVADAARLRIAESVTWRPGAHEPATVELDVAPENGSTASLLIVSVAQTVLLALVDGSGERVDSLPVGVEVTADGASATSVLLSFVPSRCDPHAVAEDKLGTLFPLEVRIDGGEPGTIYVAASDDTKVQIYDYIADYCGY
jgi:hypothetical protein